MTPAVEIPTAYPSETSKVLARNTTTAGSQSLSGILVSYFYRHIYLAIFAGWSLCLTMISSILYLNVRRRMGIRNIQERKVVGTDNAS
jgi:hypothetical protein